MKNLYLVRHGHTIDNEKMRYSGYSDCDLSEVGKKQVEKLTEYLKEYKIDKIYASKLKRTMQTIGSFADFCNIEVERLEGLNEMNFGLLDGLNFKQIQELYPSEVEKMFSVDSLYTFPEGENLEIMYNRNISTLKKIIDDDKDVDNVIICAHMGTIRNILSYFMSDSCRLHWNFRVDNASVTKITFDSDLAILEMMGYRPYDKSLLRPFYKVEE